MSQEAASASATATLGNQWRILAAVLPGVMLTMLDAASLDLPKNDITQALNSDKYRIQWIFSAYLIGAASGMCLTGFLVGRLGLRSSYLLGLAAFSSMAGLCALASDVVWMTPFRFLQGFGTGLTISTAMVLLWRTFPTRRAQAMAVYGMGVYLAALAGPALGGFLTYEHSWRWIFDIDAPLALGMVVLAWRWLPVDGPGATSSKSFDAVGFLLAMAFLIPLHVALDMGQYWGWFVSPFFIPWIVMFAVFFAAFIAWGFWSTRPLFDLRMFAIRNFALGIGVKVIFSINLYTLLSLLSPYMIDLRGYQWWQGGLVYLPAFLAMFAVLAADLSWGESLNRKLRMSAGLATMALMTWVLSAVDIYTSKYWLAAYLMLWGTGAGLVVVPALLTIFEGLSPHQTAQVAGLFNITRTQPAFVAMTLLAALWVQTSDNNFDRLRLNITHNRPIVAEATRAPARYFNERGSPGTFQPKQARALLTQWVHENSRAWALGTVLRCLAVVTGAGILLALAVRQSQTRRPVT